MLSLFRRTLALRSRASINSSHSRRCFSGSYAKTNKDEEDLAQKQESQEESKDESNDQNSQPTHRETDLSAAQRNLVEAESSLKAIHHQLLLKYADAENKRRERLGEVKKRDAANVAKFAERVSDIYHSLENVCDVASSKVQASEVEERVKSLSEGLFMTRDIMKNILAKHNVEPKPRK